MELSIVIPIYNESSLIHELGQRLNTLIETHFNQKNVEVILINDGSNDDSLEKLLLLHQKNPNLKVLNLSRNFGHQVAITAGMDHAKGQAVIVMDGDLQDPPELIPTMYQKFLEGFDVVYALREKRKGENLFKLITASLFYRILKRLAGIEIPLDTGDFRLMSRRAVDSFLKLRESHRFIRGLVSWIGYKQIGVPYQRDERLSGETKFPVSKMLKFAWDGITSFSTLPLKAASWLGSSTIILSILYTAYVLYTYLFAPQKLEPGWSSLVIIVLFMGGIQLMILGMIGEYLGRISEEIKQRPLYFVDKFHS